MNSPTLSLTSALDGGEWSTPRPGRFTPGNDPVKGKGKSKGKGKACGAYG